jgi:hypothetical protein
MVDCIRDRVPMLSLRKERRMTSGATANPTTAHATRIPMAMTGLKAPPISQAGSPASVQRVRCPAQYVGRTS